MPQLNTRTMAAAAVVPLMILAAFGRCRHSNYGFPQTKPNPHNGNKVETRIVCTDCGDSALYDAQNFKRVGPWEHEPPQSQTSGATLHARTA
jgi:hypothetical protein